MAAKYTEVGGYTVDLRTVSSRVGQNFDDLNSDSGQDIP